MNFTLSQVFLLGILYLASLFAAAWVAEKNWLPKKLTHHPLTYTLALASYASAWAFFGSFGLAAEQGLAFLAYYLGISLVFSLMPLLVLPLLRLTQAYQLTSIADLLAFRFKSPWVGVLTALGLLIGSLPLLAIQIQAVGDVIYLLTNQGSPYKLALVFCLAISAFTSVFGTRNLSLNQKNTGLIFALAFESLVKLVAFGVLGIACLVLVFGGFSGLQTWLSANPASLQLVAAPASYFVWPSLLLIFFASAFSMPHIFHIIFMENFSEQALVKASRLLPIYLLLIALPIPVIYWANLASNTGLPAEYASLALGGTWNLLVLLVSLAAASGTIILLTLALAPMVLNHVVLAVYRPPVNFDLYFWLVRIRRLLIGLIIAAAYVVYLTFSPSESLVNLGLIAFIACIQFFPASLASVFWSSANRKGLLAGLAVGFSCWLVGLISPNWLAQAGFQTLHTTSFWLYLGLVATLANLLVFVVVSLLTASSPAEKAAAADWAFNSANPLVNKQLQVANLEDFTSQLSLALGKEIAEHQTQLALSHLGFSSAALTQFQLAQLREQVQANLSGLMGAGVAQSLVNRYLPWQPAASSFASISEEDFSSFSDNLTGMAKTLNQLRNQHRQTLMHLPLGICTLGENQQVMLWNLAMEKLTGLNYRQVIGKPLSQLPNPWQNCFTCFLAQTEVTSTYRQALEEASSNSIWLGMHKGQIEEAEAYLGKQILLVENQSHLKQLEDQLIHKERLASIGKLAAGVAHEIGNPLTGISSLAQNLKYDAADPQEVIQAANQILELTQRITKIVESLIGFAYAGRTPVTLFETTNLKQVFLEALNLINLSAKGRNRQISLDCPEEIYLKADPQRLTQVLVNLLANARDATQNQQEIYCHVTSQANQLVIDIHDQGEGLTQEELSQLFEPFFTTKEAGKGSGLGLALVFSIVEQHQGSISATSPSSHFNQGSCFSLTFPLEKPPYE